MPRDDWAKARSKDIGRKALRSGNYFKSAKSKRKRFSKKRKTRDRAALPSCSCQAGLTVCVKTFKNGTVHIECRCDTCRKFLGWLPQTEENMDLAVLGVRV